jgi:hypothetical protein
MNKNLIIIIVLVSSIYAEAQNTNPYPSSGFLGLGTTSPTQQLDVRGNIYTTGSLLVDGGDVVLKRTNWSFGYVARPNVAGYKKLQFAVEGGGPLEDLYLNSERSYFTGRVGIGNATPAERLTIGGSDGNMYLGDNLYPGYNGIWLNGSTTGTDYNFLSRASDKNLYINRPLNASIYFRIQNNTQMVLGANGALGIGNSSPGYKLTVTAASQGDGLWVGGTGATNVALLNNITTGAWNALSQPGDNLLLWKGSALDNTDAGGLVLAPWSGGYNGLRIASTGNVAIGTVNPGTYKLAVEGTIGARKVKVTSQPFWPDYVFEKDYRLPSLVDLEKFIQKHKHLPEVPSAKEADTKGIDLGDNQALLLKKIEELTLYIIDQNKMIMEQGSKISQLEKLIRK